MVQALEDFAELDPEPKKAVEVHSAGRNQRLEAVAPRPRAPARPGRRAHQLDRARNALKVEALDEVVLPAEGLDTSRSLEQGLYDDARAITVSGSPIYDPPTVSVRLLGDRVAGEQHGRTARMGERHRVPAWAEEIKEVSSLGAGLRVG